jgi:hypothetical protein
MKVTTIGIDLAKTVFQVHGVDERGKVVLRKQLRLKMVMHQVLLDGVTERRLPDEDHSVQAFLFDRAHKSLGKSIQIWRTVTAPGPARDRPTRPPLLCAMRSRLASAARSHQRAEGHGVALPCWLGTAA